MIKFEFLLSFLFVFLPLSLQFDLSLETSSFTEKLERSNLNFLEIFLFFFFISRRQIAGVFWLGVKKSLTDALNFNALMRSEDIPASNVSNSVSWKIFAFELCVGSTFTTANVSNLQLRVYTVRLLERARVICKYLWTRRSVGDSASFVMKPRNVENWNGDTRRYDFRWNVDGREFSSVILKFPNFLRIPLKRRQNFARFLSRYIL